MKIRFASVDCPEVRLEVILTEAEMRDAMEDDGPHDDADWEAVARAKITDWVVSGMLNFPTPEDYKRID